MTISPASLILVPPSPLFSIVLFLLFLYFFLFSMIYSAFIVFPSLSLLLFEMELELLTLQIKIAPHLRDVLYAIDGNAEYTKEGAINFERISLLGRQISILLSFKNRRYSLPSHQNLKVYLLRLGGEVLTEDELYERSLIWQPLQDSAPFLKQSSSNDEISSNHSTPMSPSMPRKSDSSSSLIDDITVSDILDEPMLCNGFRKFLLKESSGEYIHFLKDASRFRSLPPDISLRNSYRFPLHSPSAPSLLSISFTLPSPHLFSFPSLPLIKNRVFLWYAKAPFSFYSRVRFISAVL